jgi:hypothetical protein
MATTRRRSPGFSSRPVEEAVKEEETELKEITPTVESKPLEVVVEEKEEPVKEIKEPKPFVEQTITPVENVGPRFVPEATAPTVAAPRETPKPSEPVAPRRHPRNTPKFSRSK